MKDVSKRFFDIAGSHPNALLRAAVDYEPPPPTHFIRRPRNVLNDPPDALTAAVIDQAPLLHPGPLTASGGQERKPTRDGFRRHPCRDDSLRRRPQCMSSAVGTHMCRPAALGEAIIVSDLSRLVV
ncbi:hypothetical protein EVAR_64902_1 [Eumeta japonica]|uniref:Uncharacterized protein n=1 Tax=Eumeta variegata TaxID=151549 RepID=A0A4C1ZR89_EUMVA|nr:hypothetical protein EVAR_64902_1 [Eumeta japonica]